MKEPWQPQITREPVFNAFANPLARAGELENPPPPQTEISGQTFGENGLARE